MNALFFVAETPRAGESGHRFILPPGCSEGSSLAAEFCRNAVKYRAGKNFVGVKQPVVQHLPNGAVRRGVETLVLVGVDYPRLDNDQKQHLRTVLARRLADLETLVTQRIDWKREGQSLVVTRPEFGNWLREDGLVHFPCAPLSTGPLIERRRLRLSHGLVAVLVMIVMGVGAASSVGIFTGHGKHKEQPSIEKRGGNPFEEALQKLANETDAQIDVVVPALFKGAFPDAPLPAQKELVAALRSSEVYGEIIYYKDNNKINTIAFVKGDEVLENFLDKNPNRTTNEALNLRRQIAKFGNALTDLHDVLKDIPIEQQSVRLNLNGRTGIGKLEENPVSPFFTTQDSSIVSLLAALLRQYNPSAVLSLDNLPEYREPMLNFIGKAWPLNRKLLEQIPESNSKKFSTASARLIASIEALGSTPRKD